ncbi:hypothetical protein EON83_26900 [bacterium]|nr:MAG: hypothetical protein EON83_26900 [bacterium]
MIDNELKVRVRLAAQVALWRQVPPILRAVSVDVDEQKVYFRCICDGVPSESEQELLSCAASELIADFSAPYTIEEEYLQVEFPNPMSHLKFLVFLRYENPTVLQP